MPLRRVAPQWVEHTDGWSVASADREHMQYEAAGKRAIVGVDRGTPTTRVYVRSLAWVAPDGSETALTEAEQVVIWPRFIEGMEELGMKLELFDG